MLAGLARRVAAGPLLVVLLAGSGRAADGAAAALSKVTWSQSRDVTRLRFSAGRPVSGLVERASESVLRVDLRDVAAGAVPPSLEVGTPHVRSLVRIPDIARAQLPPGVSLRWLVRLQDPAAGFAFERREDGFELLVGDAEKLGAARRWEGEGSFHASVLSEPARGDEAPAPSDALAPLVPFVVGADQPVRFGPSSLSSVVGDVRAGESRVADARRGSWLHLSTGGWIQHALPEAPNDINRLARAPAVSPVVQQRTPMAWSVMTLGTGIGVELTELPLGLFPDADAIVQLFAKPVQLLRIQATVVEAQNLGLRLPPKEGRVVLTLKDGTELRTLDPYDVPLKNPADADALDRAFTVPEIQQGETWSGVLLLPFPTDLTQVEEAKVDLDGRLHKLYLLPGSGEIVAPEP